MVLTLMGELHPPRVPNDVGKCLVQIVRFPPAGIPEALLEIHQAVVSEIAGENGESPVLSLQLLVLAELHLEVDGAGPALVLESIESKNRQGRSIRRVGSGIIRPGDETSEYRRLRGQLDVHPAGLPLLRGLRNIHPVEQVAESLVEPSEGPETIRKVVEVLVKGLDGNLLFRSGHIFSLRNYGF